MSSHDDIIWAAGFFDGEGCISITRCRSYFNLDVSAFQNHRDPLEDFVSLFGGTIYMRPDGFIWRVHGRFAVRALTEMLPYMRVKHTQAALALQFQERKLKVGQKHPDSDSRVAARELDEVDWKIMRDLKVTV